MSDPNKKSPRNFQCRDVLWDTFEQMARELECSIDYLINEAMKNYARQRSYNQRTPFPGRTDSPGVPAMPSQSQGAPPPLPQQPPAPGLSGAGSAPSPPITPPPMQPAQPKRPPSLPPPPPPPKPRTPGPALAGSGAPLAPPPARQAAQFPPPPPVKPQPRPAPMMPGPSPVQTSRTQTGQPGVAPPMFPQQHSPAVQQPPPLPGVQSPQRPPVAAPATGYQSAQGQLSIWYMNQQHTVNKDRFIIGRGKQSSDLTIRDPNVSRQHAMVEFVGGQYFMVDMGSTNGIEHNGQRIARRAVQEGDVFRICDHELRFTYR